MRLSIQGIYALHLRINGKRRLCRRWRWSHLGRWRVCCRSHLHRGSRSRRRRRITAAGPAGVLCGRSDREVELGDLIGGVEGGLALCRVSCCSILSIAAYFTIKLSNCSFVGCPLGTGATGGRFGLAAKDGGGLGTAGFLHMAFGGSMGSSSESKDGGLTATFGGLGSSSESMSIMSTV